MSNICVVASCNTRRKGNKDETTAIKCFSFPKDPDLKKQWLHLCQVKEDHNKKVCIKHFKEDDFVDGLKARLMCVQPTRLKKDAVPSQFLCTEIETEESKQKQIQNQEEMLKKYICKKKRQVRMSNATKGPKVRISNPTKGSMEYLSKLVPIAPKGQGVKKGTIVALKKPLLTQKDPLPAQQKSKIKKESKPPEDLTKVSTCRKVSVILPNVLITPQDPISEPPKTNPGPETQNVLKPGSVIQHNMKTKQVQADNLLYQLKILQHDNAIYKKRIETLKESQKSLLAHIKELEAKIENQKHDFVGKIKKTLAHVLTSNQIDNMLGNRKHIYWTTEEYSKALKLLHFSRHAYNYVRESLKYPMPCIANVYKWSTKNELKKPHLEKTNQICDNDKENGVNFVIDDDQMILDDHVIGDVELDTKNECTVKNNVNIDFDQYVEKEYTIKVDEYDIKGEIDYNMDNENGDDHSNDHENINIADESDQDIFNIDHIIEEDGDPMSDNQNDEFYEELIIDNDYSDDEMFHDLQKRECIDKDNG